MASLATSSDVSSVVAASAAAAASSASSSSSSEAPSGSSILVLEPFDIKTRYCLGDAGVYVAVQNDPHALDHGFWGRPTDPGLLRTVEDAIKLRHGFGFARSGNTHPAVFCRWCQDNLNISCSPVDYVADVASSSTLSAQDAELYNEDKTALNPNLRCASRYTMKEMLKWQSGDYTICIKLSNLSVGNTQVTQFYCLPRAVEGVDACFILPTATEYVVEITHRPTVEALHARASVKRAKSARGAMVSEQTELDTQPRPCFVVKRLQVGGRVVNTSWKGEPVFNSTTGVATFTGYDWEATNAGSFLFTVDPETAITQPVLIRAELQAYTWVPAVKSALPHMTAHGALAYADVSGASGAGGEHVQSAYVSSTGQSGGFGAFGGGSRGGNAGPGLSARLQQNRTRKQGARGDGMPDKDGGPGRRVVACTALTSSVGKTYTAVEKDGETSFVVGLVCTQTPDAIRKDNARLALNDSGLDFWAAHQKSCRKRIREKEKELEELRNDLTDLNKEVANVVREHADAVRMFTPAQLESNASMQYGETKQVSDRILQLEQERYAATKMHYEA